MPQRISDFRQIESEFTQRVQSAVLCNAATVDRQNRPRSRVLHPLWEEGPQGWICVNRDSPKARHLAANPYMSLAYLADPLKPVFVECKAAWEDDAATRARVWALFKGTPEPVGYDPGTIWQEPNNPNFGLLRLEPWLIRLYDLLHQEAHRIWRPVPNHVVLGRRSV